MGILRSMGSRRRRAVRCPPPLSSSRSGIFLVAGLGQHRDWVVFMDDFLELLVDRLGEVLHSADYAPSGVLLKVWKIWRRREGKDLRPRGTRQEPGRRWSRSSAQVRLAVL